MNTIKKGAYHHGHLRRALLDAALELVAEFGIEGLSLRQVAQKAGVSSAAPYHHFADKATLVEALKVEYWKAFTDALIKAASVCTQTALDKLLAIGKEYIRFGLKNPAGFRLIFHSEHHGSGLLEKQEECVAVSEVELVADKAFGVLLNTIVDCQKEGFVREGNPLPFTLTAWATVHGVTTLLLDGPTGKLPLISDEPEKNIDQLAESIISTLFTGLLKH